MKYLIFFVLLLPGMVVYAQKDCPYFTKYMDKGDAILKVIKKTGKGDFNAAINAYSTAMLHCPDSASSAREKIIQVYKQIDTLRMKAEKDASDAKINEAKARKKEKEANEQKENALAKKEELYKLSVSFLMNNIATEMVNYDPTFSLALNKHARDYNPSNNLLEITATKIYEEYAFYKNIVPVYSTDEKLYDTGVIYVAFSLSLTDTTIFVGYADGNARLFNKTGNFIKNIFTDTSTKGFVVFARKGDSILTGSVDGTVKLWNLNGLSLQTFKGHKQKVCTLAFSPAGDRILTGYFDSTAILWDTRTGKALDTLPYQKSKVFSLAFSPRGDKILAGFEDNVAILYELKGDSLSKPKILKNHRGSVNSVAFSPTGDMILTGSSDKTAMLWDAKSDSILNTFKGHTGGVNAVAFSTDGKTILTGSDDRTALLWSISNENIIKEFKGHTGSVNAVAFSPVDPNRIITGSEDKTARIWYYNRNKNKEFTISELPVTSVAFSPADNMIVTGSADGITRLCNLEGKEIMRYGKKPEIIKSIAFSPDGETMLTGVDDSTAILRDLKKDTILSIFKGHKGIFSYMEFSPDGKKILTGSDDSTGILWNLHGEILRIFKNVSADVYVAFSPEGKTILTGLNGSIILWDTTGKKLHDFKGRKIYSFDFSPDGKTILTGSSDSTARLYDLEGNLKHEFKSNTDGIYDVVFSPDGKSILTVFNNRTAFWWNLDGEKLHEFKDYTYSYAFSPDGTSILMGYYANAVLYDLNGNIKLQLRGNTDIITSVSFSPDGKTILTASMDKTARLWDLNGTLLRVIESPNSIYAAKFIHNGESILFETADNYFELWGLEGNLIKRFNNHTLPEILAVAIAPGGKTILTGSGADNANLLLWDRADGKKPIKEFKGHTGYVNAVAFSVTGDSILSGSSDSTAILWDVKTGIALRKFRVNSTIPGDTINSDTPGKFTGHEGAVNAVAFSKNGSTMLTGSSDGNALLWNVERDSILGTFKSFDAVNAVAFSPNDSTILTGSSDGYARLWDLQGNILHIYYYDGSPVRSVAFSPDGKRIIAGIGAPYQYNSGAILLYDTAYFDPIKKIPEENTELFGVVNSLVFLPDGKTVLAGSGDGTARLWSLEMSLEEFISNGYIEDISEWQRNNLLLFLLGENDQNPRNTSKITPADFRTFLKNLKEHKDYKLPKNDEELFNRSFRR